MGERIQVGIRVRPSLGIDGDRPVLQIQNNSIYAESHQSRSFKFDKVFNPQDDQETIFADIGQNILENTLAGFNSTLLTYGQTGSGKTFTVFGDNEEPGIVPRLLIALFEKISSLRSKFPTNDYHVEVSMLEIYNEKVRDLLGSKNGGFAKVREVGEYFKVLNLTTVVVHSREEVEQVAAEGAKGRSIASTNKNEKSSRAHTIFKIRFVQKIKENEGTRVKRSEIVLVDLAGSERVGQAEMKGNRFKEGVSINLSLMKLGECIKALVDLRNSPGHPTPSHIFRGSVMTQLLKRSLVGNSKTIMIATISADEENFQETLSTLKYANRMKELATEPIVNEESAAKIIKELEEEITRLKSAMKKSRRPSNLSQTELEAILEAKMREIELLTQDYEERLAQELRKSEALKKKLEQNFDELLAEELEKMKRDKGGISSSSLIQLRSELDFLRGENQFLRNEIENLTKKKRKCCFGFCRSRKKNFTSP
ncbi:Oidioi.mRNA.OKI2018_I69.chr1.g1333.t1.cds [Oikopleura dioica]|uniref:Kinesin-like protein n=1 Tax=Oikopleura dioica TaxID=34765 RepID=A0ABN7SUM2_OIKDI|nr:Oidioi.mRNA.OKI2018_I69.chr1.g1333.t1.cds [Oikopleura dioica]